MAEKFLFVKPEYVNWSICSDLKGGNNEYISSGSNGLRCPASPESRFNERWGAADWTFSKDANGIGGHYRARGEVVVSCSTCGLSTD